MTYDTAGEFSRLQDIALATVYSVVSPSARSNISEFIAAKAVVQYYEAVESGTDIRSPEGWVATTARRRAIDAMRKWQLEKERGHRIDVDEGGTDVYMTMLTGSLSRFLDANQEPGADERAGLWVAELIESVISDPTNREIALRCIVDEEKPGIVAADLGMDAPLVSKRIARLKTKLRAEISVDDLRL